VEQYYERIERDGNTCAIVFVHGILGHYRETWGDFPHLVTHDTPLNHCDVICWGYPSRLQIPRFPSLPLLGNRMPDLTNVADAFCSDLLNPEIGGSYKDLLLVGHSMGGLVIMKMVISALTMTPENSAVLDRIRHIMLYATPSDGVQLPAVFKVHRQAKSIDCTSEFVNQLRSDWIKRVYATRPDDQRQPGKRYIPITAVVGLEDNAVPRESSMSYINDVQTAQGNHTEVCKPSGRDNTSFQILKGVVLRSMITSPAPVSTHEELTSAKLSSPSESSPETAQVGDLTQKQNAKWAAAWDEGEQGHFEAAYRLFEEYFSEQREDSSGVEFLAFIAYDFYRRKGWAEGFSRIKQLAADNPTVVDSLLWLARAYEASEQWDLALENLRKAQELSAGSDPLRFTVELASCLVRAGMGKEALAELRTGLSQAQDPPDKAKMYKAFGDTFLKLRRSEPLLGIACYEKALALQPADTSLRFDLAYEHGDVISSSAAFYHYRMLLRHKENKAALNNAGVAARDLNLPLTSIDYYAAAADQNHTLAMSNMAKSLINSGFEKMAKELLDKARREEDVHENVDIHLGEIKRRRKQEKEKIEELEKKVGNIVRWHCREGDAIVQPQIDPHSLTGSYREADGTTLTVTCRPDGIVLGSRQSPDEVLSLSGRVEGRLLRFSWKTNPTTTPAALLAPTSLLALGKPSQPSSGEGVLIVEENGSVLSGYRVKNGAPLEPTPWRLTRANGAR